MYPYFGKYPNFKGVQHIKNSVSISGLASESWFTEGDGCTTHPEGTLNPSSPCLWAKGHAQCLGRRVRQETVNTAATAAGS